MRDVYSGREGFNTFLKLPEETISDILVLLDARDLLRCAQVCKSLNKIIESSRLQYIIELGVYGMISVHHTRLGPSFHARRKVLKEREHSWKHFKWRNKHALDLPARGNIYEYIGGFYGNFQEPLISLIELPSANAVSSPDTSTRSWVHDLRGLSVVDFTMDPSQDILILLAHAPTDSEYLYDLHIRTMSTGEPHPRAECAQIKTFKRTALPNDDSESFFSFRVQVAGDFLALLVKVPEVSLGYLEIWNFTRSPEISHSISSKIGIDDFSIISSDAFLMVMPMGLVEIWSLHDPSESGIPCVQARYALPEPNEGFIYFEMTTSAGPATGVLPPSDVLTSEKTLYLPCPDERIYAICVSILNPDHPNPRVHSYVFFVNLRTFLYPSQTISDHLAEHGSAEPISWELWGPENTRWFPETTGTDWQHALYGYRAVEALNAAALFADPPIQRNLRVLDFNPYTLTQMVDDEDEKDGWRGRIVRVPSFISAQDAFAHDIVSSLPYREIISKETFTVTYVMMDDRRILLLKRAQEGELTGIDVLTL